MPKAKRRFAKKQNNTLLFVSLIGLVLMGALLGFLLTGGKFTFKSKAAVSRTGCNPNGYRMKYTFEQGPVRVNDLAVWDFSECSNLGFRKEYGDPLGTPPVVIDTDCVVGKCMRFDGVNDVVKHNMTVVDPEKNIGPFTMTIFVKPDYIIDGAPCKRGDIKCTVMLHRAAQKDIGLMLKRIPDPQGGYMVQAVGMLQSMNRTIESTSAIPANEWSSLGLTYDGTTSYLYVNGVSEGSYNYVFPYNWLEGTENGGHSLGGDAFSVWGSIYKGDIDEVRFQERALNATQMCEEHACPMLGAGTHSCGSTQVTCY